jgi:hypothetical protein
LYCLLFIPTNGQVAYSIDSLGVDSPQELKVKLEKSEKLKKAGVCMLVGGPLTALVGVGLFNAAFSGKGGVSRVPGAAGAGFFMMVGGAAATIISLPVLSVADTRIKRINELLSSRNSALNLGIRTNSLIHLDEGKTYTELTVYITF